jgi:hypothetical protein
LLGYFMWKITILRQQILFFPILGGGAPGAPPLDPPLYRNTNNSIYNLKFSRHFWDDVWRPQGGNLSPFWFAVFLSDLEDYLYSHNMAGLQTSSQKCLENLRLYLLLFVLPYRGGSSGGAPGAPPPKIGKNKICWRKIVIFHMKYPNNFRTSLRSAQFF